MTAVPLVVSVKRCEAPSFSPVSFEVFCPKAFAGIGSGVLHPTTLDRCVPILLERKLPDDPVTRFRSSRFEPEADVLRDRIRDWIESASQALECAEPALPDALDDRQQETWEPLLAIADAAGGSWPAVARQAALSLHADSDLEDLPLSIQLLSDIRRAFDDAEIWTLGSEELCTRLHLFRESPWGTWTTHGVKTGITPRALAYRLRPFGIRPKTVRLGGEDKPTRKGYRRDWFEPAWERYVPKQLDDTDDDA